MSLLALLQRLVALIAHRRERLLRGGQISQMNIAEGSRRADRFGAEVLSDPASGLSLLNGSC
jgi:hypothetical protein